jgi:SMI1 / KNR4 family (SUKH-1)
VATSWIDRIGRWTDDAVFQPPASAEQIARCEAALDQRLPADLAALFRESNGVGQPYGDLVWSTERIAAENRELRGYADFAELYMPFDPLLFFADAGNGDLFGFVIRDRPDDVFHWDHETDSRTMIAGGLAQFLEGWLAGTIIV